MQATFPLNRYGITALMLIAAIAAWAQPSEPPVISGLDGNNVVVGIGESSAELDQGTIVTLSDPDSADFMTGGITVNITLNYAPDKDSIEVISGTGYVVTGSIIKVGPAAVGWFEWNAADGQLAVVFTGEVTLQVAESVLKSLRYNNSNVLADTSNRTMVLLMEDGDGAISLPQTVIVGFAADCLLQSGFEDSEGC